MLQPDGSIRTTDMTFAALLSCHGYSPELRKSGRKAVWVLAEDDVDDFCEELIEDYNANKARVEPRRFMREIRAVRKDLYRFLGVSSKPAGAPVEPSG